MSKRAPTILFDYNNLADLALQTYLSYWRYIVVSSIILSKYVVSTYIFARLDTSCSMTKAWFVGSIIQQWTTEQEFMFDSWPLNKKVCSVQLLIEPLYAEPIFLYHNFVLRWNWVKFGPIYLYSWIKHSYALGYSIWRNWILALQSVSDWLDGGPILKWSYFSTCNSDWDAIST